jgi:hypothetical protein
MASAPRGKRIVLQLDPRVTFEALVLNRLERIPEGRRQEWLRRLLIQGFRQECQALRMVQDGLVPRRIEPPNVQGNDVGRPKSAFATWLAKPAPPSNAGNGFKPAALDRTLSQDQGKPFAVLRKVIG